MAIFYNCIISVKGDKASLDRKIYIYKGNKNIEFYFTIKDAPYSFRGQDLVVSSDAKKCTIKFIKPNGEKVKFENVPVEEGKVKIKIDSTFADELSEIGAYSFQIDLLDDSQDVGIVSIPPVIDEFHVLAPLFD